MQASSGCILNVDNPTDRVDVKQPQMARVLEDGASSEEGSTLHLPHPPLHSREIYSTSVEYQLHTPVVANIPLFRQHHAHSFGLTRGAAVRAPLLGAREFHFCAIPFHNLKCFPCVIVRGQGIVYTKCTFRLHTNPIAYARRGRCWENALNGVGVAKINLPTFSNPLLSQKTFFISMFQAIRTL